MNVSGQRRTRFPPAGGRFRRRNQVRKSGEAKAGICRSGAKPPARFAMPASAGVCETAFASPGARLASRDHHQIRPMA